jgi:sulfopyruvate decarboxylase subunit alpha
MPVSVKNSHLIYDALKACDIRLLSALPETWLVHLIRLADEDPDVILVRLAKEEEGVGISAGAHLAGVKSAMLMQNHGFLASINGIVSLAHLYKIPLLMLISYRGEFGERDPWQTQGGGVTEALLQGLGIPYKSLAHPDHVAARIRAAQTLAESALKPVALLLSMRSGPCTRSSNSVWSSRSWGPSQPSYSHWVTGPTSSICSTRWVSRRRWGWALPWPGPSCRWSCWMGTALS